MGLLRKTLAVFMVGFGIGAIMVLLLPSAGWAFVIGAVLLIIGIAWLGKC